MTSVKRSPACLPSAHHQQQDFYFALRLRGVDGQLLLSRGRETDGAQGTQPQVQRAERSALLPASVRCWGDIGLELLAPSNTGAPLCSCSVGFEHRGLALDSRCHPAAPLWGMFRTTRSRARRSGRLRSNLDALAARLSSTFQRQQRIFVRRQREAMALLVLASARAALAKPRIHGTRHAHADATPRRLPSTERSCRGGISEHCHAQDTYAGNMGTDRIKRRLSSVSLCAA